MIDVLIAGGGISGLTAARDLVRAGHRVRLIESRPRLGGVIATEQVEGFTIETGPDGDLSGAHSTRPEGSSAGSP